jgi:hypothetical protein
MKVLGDSMALIAGGQAHLGTSGALGVVVIPAGNTVVATMEFAGSADVDYALQADTAWPTSLLRALRAAQKIKA